MTQPVREIFLITFEFNGLARSSVYIRGHCTVVRSGDSH